MLIQGWCQHTAIIMVKYRMVYYSAVTCPEQVTATTTSSRIIYWSFHIISPLHTNCFEFLLKQWSSPYFYVLFHAIFPHSKHSQRVLNPSVPNNYHGSTTIIFYARPYQLGYQGTKMYVVFQSIRFSLKDKCLL